MANFENIIIEFNDEVLEKFENKITDTCVNILTIHGHNYS